MARASPRARASDAKPRMPAAVSEPTLLCLASYFKGEDFLRECREQGARVILLTVEELKDEPWPLESIDDFRWMPTLLDRSHVLNGVSFLARSERIERVVALDEFDLEMAAVVREHLALPGMGTSATLSVRDKLHMRLDAHAAGIGVPRFTSLVNDAALRDWTRGVPAPWILKPRGDAATKGIRRIADETELWPTIEALGDRRSSYLLEAFVAGDVFHVDGIVADGRLVFAEAHGYARPPFEVTRGGGLFMSRTLERDSSTARALLGLTAELVTSIGIARGAVHTEFIRATGAEEPLFLEIAARVGGAHIADMVEAASGVNLWREWARVEVADLRGEVYRPPEPRRDYAGIIVSLARQEWPDDSSFDAAEIVWRLKKKHHIGFVMRSSDPDRIRALQADYGERIARDFSATVPET